MFLEIYESFQSLDDWLRWEEHIPQLRNREYIDDLARNVLATGFIDPSFGTVAAQEIVSHGTNYREGLQARGATSRYRALLRPAIDYLLSNGWCSTVYLAEHVTDFGELAPNRFPYLVRSEFMPARETRDRLPYVRHENPVELSFPDRSFDIYLAADTMVYAPSIETFLCEAHRILRRGGILLATFPFRYGDRETDVHAALVNDQIVHYSTPALDADPLDDERIRTIFFVPGWDILDMARSVGYSSAEIIVQSSRTHAIVGAEIAAVFVLKVTV